jgi:hypothetical protein
MTQSSTPWWIPNGKAKFPFIAFRGNAEKVADRASVYEFAEQFDTLL